MHQQTGGIVDQLMGLLTVGEEWVLYLLLAVSVACVAIIIERVVTIFKNKGNIAELKTKLNSFLSSGNTDEALKFFSAQKSTPARLVAAALDAFDRSPEAMQEVIDAEVIRERMRLEKFLDFLGTVGSNAPFVGLFGTVLGIIQAFHALALAQTADPKIVMAGISAALVATAVGLFVAIPALIAFNYFKGEVRDMLRMADTLTKPLISHSLDQALGRSSTGKEASSKHQFGGKA